jgi:hypothetical protein
VPEDKTGTGTGPLIKISTHDGACNEDGGTRLKRRGDKAINKGSRGRRLIAKRLY